MLSAKISDQKLYSWNNCNYENKENPCYGLNCVQPPPPHSNVIVFGDMAYKEVITLK